MSESSNNVKIVYIVAHGHSGTTLLDTLIGNMPGAVSTGEVERIAQWAASDDPDKVCTCGAPIVECELWGPCCDRLRSDAGEETLTRRSFWARFPVHLGDHGKRFYVGFLLPLLLLLGSWRLLGLFRRYAPVSAALRATDNSWHLFRALQSVSGARIIVDSSKSPLRMKALYLTRRALGQGQPLYIIHMVRDGRAIVSSYQRRIPRSVAHYANEWRRRLFYRAAMLFTVSRKDRLTLKYEDLASSPLATLQAICTFIGEPESLAGEAFENAGAVKHNVSGNPARLDRDALARVRLDERWRQELSAEDLSAFRRRAGLLNRWLGYR